MGRLEISHHRVALPGLRLLRVLHLSDVHIRQQDAWLEALVG